jgi:hypothetical protein
VSQGLHADGQFYAAVDVCDKLKALALTLSRMSPPQFELPSGHRTLAKLVAHARNLGLLACFCGRSNCGASELERR